MSRSCFRKIRSTSFGIESKVPDSLASNRLCFQKRQVNELLCNDYFKGVPGLKIKVCLPDSEEWQCNQLKHLWTAQFGPDALAASKKLRCFLSFLKCVNQHYTRWLWTPPPTHSQSIILLIHTTKYQVCLTPGVVYGNNKGGL